MKHKNFTNIVDDCMYKLNNAIQQVYGERAVGSVCSDEELIHVTTFAYQVS